VYTIRKRSRLGRKVIVAKTILLLLFYSDLAVAEKEEPVIKIWTDSKEHSIKAEMTVPRPHDSVYRILKDYEAIDDHISLFKDSRVIGREENIVHLRQITSVEILFFRIESETYLLVQEISDKKITFTKEKGDFKIHQGSWTLIPAEDGRSTLVKYEVQAIPDFYVPGWLVNYFMEKEVRKGFEELYLWIMNQSAKSLISSTTLSR
jgi:ribosome-associated toxin RatA of RatAB toxin-antitoxin module